jgi:hypothetical protein
MFALKNRLSIVKDPFFIALGRPRTRHHFSAILLANQARISTSIPVAALCDPLPAPGSCPDGRCRTGIHLIWPAGRKPLSKTGQCPTGQKPPAARNFGLLFAKLLVIKSYSGKESLHASHSLLWFIFRADVLSRVGRMRRQQQHDARPRPHSNSPTFLLRPLSD